MRKKLIIVLASFLCLMFIPSVVNAATITSATFDKEVYLQGQTGYILVTIYNDEYEKIRVTELTATIDYYYTDENVYVQKFFTSATLPVEIQQGLSDTLSIPFSLPTNIASGYTNIEVKAVTELWDTESERWRWSDHPTYHPRLFIESPYKQQLDEQQVVNQQLLGQLQEQQVVGDYLTTMMYILGATTVLFAVVIGFLFILLRKARIVAQPSA